MRKADWLWFGIAAGAFVLILAMVIGALAIHRARQAPPAAAPSASLSPALAPTDTPLLFETPTSSPTPPAAGAPPGRIVYTCQLAGDQICIMNADGSGMRQLTFDNVRHWFPSLAPDGRSVVYSAYRMDNVYEIYELDLASGLVTRLTDQLGVLKAPEISPDGRWIVFGNGDVSGGESIWIMERDGSNPRRLYAPGWDPTWSPDGERILFASLAADGSIQLFIIGRDGSGLVQASRISGMRGRSDWSPDGFTLATYAGERWQREIYFMNTDGSNLRAVTDGGDNLAPSFSPDGEWVAFMSYRDHYQDVLGCEIYVMRIRDSYVLRLTYNEYCDWQPRWGP
ncbi:MAG: hypothetical protein ABWK53_11165 [Anaerolineales bacterium]